MGYDMYEREGQFFIESSQKEDALKALREWGRKTAARRYGGWDEELQDAENLEEAFFRLGWNCVNNAANDIADLYFEDGALHDENEWMDAIAPFVKQGSYIEMVGEDNEFGCWYFDGETCTVYQGVVTFPGMPEIGGDDSP